MYPQQNTQNSTYPLYPPPPPNNNFPPNYLVPTGPPNPMVVAQQSQIKNYANEMVNKIKENQEKMNMENELKQLKEKLNDEKLKRLETLIKEKNPPNINIHNNPNINTNIVGAQAVANANATNIGGAVIAVDSRGRLEYSTGYFCLFLCLNIFLPGIGTIVAGAMFGKATATHADRTGELICHGVVQFLTSPFIFGWVWAIMEASRYFEIGVCC